MKVENRDGTIQDFKFEKIEKVINQVFSNKAVNELLNDRMIADLTKSISNFKELTAQATTTLEKAEKFAKTCEKLDAKINDDSEENVFDDEVFVENDMYETDEDHFILSNDKVTFEYGLENDEK